MNDVNDFGMFTDQGEVVAQKVVELARAAGLDWTQTMSIMRFIGDQKRDQYGEINDTAVREMIYSRCGFTTSFYA
jgi:enamine deaminase RidA (YjgF/YER057c/UK114 family)